MMKKNRKLGIFAIFIVAIIYGASYIARDVIIQYLHPIAIVALQLVMMAVLFTTYNIIKKNDLKIKHEDVFLLILSGLLGTSFFHFFMILSAQYIGGTLSSLLFVFATVFSLMIEFIFFKREKTKLSILSIVIALAGVYILMGIDFSDLGNINGIGYFVTLLSIISWVIYCFLSDKLSDKYEKTIVLNYQALVGATTTLPFLFIFPVELSDLLNPNVLINLMILGVMNSTIAYFLNIYAIKQIGVTFSNLFINFTPVITITIAFFLYGNMPKINQMMGGLLIIVSVLILNKDQKNVRLEKEKTARTDKILDEANR